MDVSNIYGLPFDVTFERYQEGTFFVAGLDSAPHPDSLFQGQLQHPSREPSPLVVPAGLSARIPSVNPVD